MDTGFGSTHGQRNQRRRQDRESDGESPDHRGDQQRGAGTLQPRLNFLFRERFSRALQELAASFSEDIDRIASVENILNSYVEFENIVSTDGFDNEYYQEAYDDYLPVIQSYSGKYADLYFMGPDGVIVYARNDGSEKGMSLADGGLSATSLAAGFDEALGGVSSVQDMMPFAPAGVTPGAKGKT